MIEDQVSYGDAFGLALSLTSDLELAALAADGETGIALVLDLDPGLVLCDYRLPDGETGTNVAQQLRNAGYDKPIALLTGFLAPQVRREAAEIENVHLLSKDTGAREIVAELQEIVAGRQSNAADTEVASDLSVGELEVLELLNQGMSPAEIAEKLFLSLHTIRSRIKSMHRKLNVISQVEAIAVATRRGLLVPPQ